MVLTPMHFGTDISSNTLPSLLYLHVGPLEQDLICLFAYIGVIGVTPYWCTNYIIQNNVGYCE